MCVVEVIAFASGLCNPGFRGMEVNTESEAVMKPARLYWNYWWPIISGLHDL